MTAIHHILLASHMLRKDATVRISIVLAFSSVVVIVVVVCFFMRRVLFQIFKRPEN